MRERNASWIKAYANPTARQMVVKVFHREWMGGAASHFGLDDIMTF